MKREKRKPIFKSYLFAILLAVSIAAIYLYLSLYLPPLKVARLKFSDYFFRWRQYYHHTFAKSGLRPQNIVLVTIDEESYKRLEKRWPWGRDVFAGFLNKQMRVSVA